MVISGMPLCGKTTLAKNILLGRNYLIDKPTNDIVWCYSEAQPTLFMNW